MKKTKETQLVINLNFKNSSIRVILSKKGIESICLLNKKSSSKDKNIPDFFCGIKTKKIEKDFEDYFSGKVVNFRYPMDIEAHTLFEKKVWKAASLIPHGEVRTYKWIAEKIGVPKGSRAVGNALGKNPVPIIIPCHRVVASNGSLGGFSCGISWKKKLLAIEKANILHGSPNAK